MRIACLQFSPKVGDLENNLNRADAVLSKADVEELDLMVLPELAFTGYNFKSLQEISPFLEHSGSGITSLWARTMALKYNCVVTAGYPEKVDVSPKWPTSPEYYNSAIVVNEDGETIANYRKSFLYHADEPWALEGGDGFYSGYIPGLGHTSIGICMDINPYKFEAPWNAYEFAFHILEMQTNLVVLSMAWMTREEPRAFSRMPNEPDMETLTYWVTRLEPLIRAETEEEIIVVFCNRSGTEGDATYAGTSAVLGILQGEVRVYGLLGRGQKELLVVDTSDPPFGKLIYRPDEEQETEASTHEVQQPSSGETGLAIPGQNCDSSLAALEVPATSDKDGEPTTNEPAQAQEFSMTPGVDRSPESYLKMDATARDNVSDIFTPPPPHIPVQTVVRGRSRERETDLVPPPPPMAPVFPGGISKDDSESPLRTALPPSNSQQDCTGSNDASAAEKNATVENSPVAPIDVSVAKSATVYRSPATEGPINIPPPSLPSPTHQALRPKLIIPQSPPLQPQQLHPPGPVSAASEVSVKSIQSIRSDESEVSTQTIRSNPRPPEDSTPYPHSGLPLSGYPQRKKIYGGYVTIKADSASAFSPTTPFEDLSPISASWSWRPPSRGIRTPVSAGGWAPGTPIGRRPEPFPWHALGSARSRSRDGGRFTPAKMPGQGTATTALPGGSNSLEEHRKTPVRPSSPKSRNASRSRTRERPSSSLSHRDNFVASQQLEAVSSRPNPATNSTSVVPIAASPSILDRNVKGKMVIPTPVAMAYYRPLGAVAYHQRSNSSPDRDEYYSFSPVVSAAEEQTPRTISRGRRPGPEMSEKGKGPSRERTSSADSTRNDVLHRRVRRSSKKNDGEPSHRANSRTHRDHRSRQSSRAEERMNFERVEAVICPNCPVHGSRSTSSATQGGTHRLPRYRQQGQPEGYEDEHRRRHGEIGSSASISSRHAETQTARDLLDTMSSPVSAPLEVTRSNDDAGITAAATLSIQRPMTAPSTFNPPTPRAMTRTTVGTEEKDLDNNEEFTPLEASMLIHAKEKTS